MKALFLGNVAADTANGIRAELPGGVRVDIVAEPQALFRAPEVAADADILVTNHWRSEYPPAPQVRLVQSVAAGIELIDLAALPDGVVICNAFGHETAIAEYVPRGGRAGCRVECRMAKSSAVRSGSSGSAGSAARCRAAPHYSAAV
jgi:hypothetical protein